MGAVVMKRESMAIMLRCQRNIFLTGAKKACPNGQAFCFLTRG